MTLSIYETTPKDYLHAKFDFDQTTWVVWANTQFATARFLFVFGSHRMHNIDVVYCDRRSSVVSPCVCLLGVQIPT